MRAARERGSLARLLTLIGGATTFSYVTRAVARGSSRALDAAIRQQIARLRSPAMDEVSKFVTPLTAPALLVTSSLILALRVRHRGVHVWLPIAASPLVAMMAGQTFTKCLPQQHSPSSKDGECEPCFPSGHTTGATAEMLTIAYVLRQESLIGAGGALALLTMPIIGGLNRLYRDRHWASDIVAGGAAGVVIASLLSALSEALIP